MDTKRERNTALPLLLLLLLLLLPSLPLLLLLLLPPPLFRPSLPICASSRARFFASFLAACSAFNLGLGLSPQPSSFAVPRHAAS